MEYGVLVSPICATIFQNLRIWSPRGWNLNHQIAWEQLPHVYGHTTLKTPVLVWSPKLSNVGPG